MGTHTSTPGSINTGDEGTQIGEIKTPGLMILYQADPTVVPSALAPTTNPCTVADPTLTSAQVMAEYPHFQWDPTKTWTPQSMQCWAYLALQSGQAHPDRSFSEQWGYEPYLLI